MVLGVIGNVTKKIIEFGVEHGDTILRVCAVGGVVGTAVETGRAAIKARDTIKAHEMDEELKCERIEQVDGVETNHIVYYRERTFIEKTRLTWKIWARPVFVGGTTIACIIWSDKISTKQKLALAAAYSMSEEAAKEFKDKVAETIGEKKTEKIENAITQDHMNNNPVPADEYITYTGCGEQLMYDWWSGRYFRGGQNEVDKKVNMLNKRIARKKKASTVNDLYELLNIPQIPIGDEWGWTYHPDIEDGDVTVHYYPAISSKGEPCIEVRVNPELLHIYV